MSRRQSHFSVLPFLAAALPALLCCEGKPSTSGDGGGEEAAAADDEGRDAQVESPDADGGDAPEPADEEGAAPDAFDTGADEPEDDAADAQDAEEEEETLTAAACFAAISDPLLPGPDYDQFHPVIGTHCLGTDHQDIDGVELVVYLGDSITAGTPPTMFWEYYRNVLTGMLRARFGRVEARSCAAWGARTDDLLRPPHQQILECFPAPEPKRTLVVMTVGGNDFNAMAQAAAEGRPMTEIMDMAEQAVQDMRDAVVWLKGDPSRFPGGVFVAFSNNYEFTDATGDLDSCIVSIFAGLGGSWPEGREPAIYFNEEYMRIAVDTRSDMIFLLENFCGHGFHNEDPASQCYRGPGTPRWFDLTCIHPNPAGHRTIADMFMAVVNE